MKIQGEGLGTALQAVITAEWLLTIGLLLEHEAGVNAPVGEIEAALEAATSVGSLLPHQEVIVQLLLEHGANLN